MPGSALPKKAAHLRIERDPQRRHALRRRAAPAPKLQQPGKADGGGQDSAAAAASCTPASSAAIDRDQRMLNSSGENAASAKRPCALSSAIITVDRAGESEIRQHQSRVGDRELQRRAAEEPGASAAMTQRHRSPITRRRISASAEVPSTRPANAAAAASPCVSRTPQPGRHQRCVQRALGRQPPHHLDELKCDEKCIGDRAGAEQRRDQGVAQYSEQPRGERARGHR